MKSLSVADTAKQWQVSISAAIVRLIESGETPYCLVSCDLVSVDSGEFDGRVMAKCKIDSMTLARLVNADEIMVSVLSLLQDSPAAEHALKRIELPNGCFTYSSLPEPSDIKLTASNVLLDLPNETATAEPQPSENPIKPVSRGAAQDAAILEAIRSQGHDPLKLPKPDAGKSGVKADVRALCCLNRKDVFQSKGVFDDAWQRLRAEKKIRDYTA